MLQVLAILHSTHTLHPWSISVAIDKNTHRLKIIDVIDSVNYTEYTRHFCTVQATTIANGKMN